MNRAVFPALAAAAWLACAAQAVWRFSPEGLCPFRLLTGRPCPGCGMGRAVTAAMRGDLAASWSSHPLGIPFLMIWTAWLLWGALNLFRGREFSRDFFPALRRPAVSWSVLALVLAVYAVRL